MCLPLQLLLTAGHAEIGKLGLISFDTFKLMSTIHISMHKLILKKLMTFLDEC